MASRTLRSRTLEAPRDIQSLPAGEKTPTSPAEPHSDLGSDGETVEPTPSQPQEPEIIEQIEVLTQAEVTKTSVQGPPSSATTQLEQMLATFMTVMQQSNAQLREDLSSNQKRAEHFKESIKADILTVQEILLERFDQQTQQLREEFNSKLDAENR
jgi:hypothetical protein